ncbi:MULTISPECIES: SDR family NAD(P)-dependent oxidoreductase [Nocardiopsis]|uniref:SDR family NAD(P)-dependent oxidoreductase n=1 Tax=Nocardiopsis TaxID=2013 RepID=UPI00034A090D|nr:MULTISPECIES: 3-oxoacyl-ACP reductase family protein [Nocardiopsis]PWV57403.1 3-oxoacyl-[acyl-carrier-protein] reductase [Nocardiopsis sp. L17-MgMaSL7]
MTKELNSKVALVTGGGSGLGRAVAMRLADLGAVVAVGYLNRAEVAEKTAEEIRAAGGRAQALRVDVRDYEAVSAAVQELTREHGRIDILVNNAGICTAGTIVSTDSTEGWNDVIQTNLVGAYHCIKACALPMMLQGSGAIVNVSSILGLVGKGGLSAYCASKAGLSGLTASLAAEFAMHGVRVNAVAPGYSDDTGMIQQFPIEQKEVIINERIPLQRPAQPEEIAETVVFLTREGSSYMTGQTMVVDGGLTSVIRGMAKTR